MAITKVKLIGGPKDGQWITYSTPLPKTLVITEVSSGQVKQYDYEHFSDIEYRIKK
jgi:hypothetical protein